MFAKGSINKLQLNLIKFLNATGIHFKLRKAIIAFAGLSLVFLSTLLLLRVFEFFYITKQYGLPADVKKIALLSLMADFIFWVKISFWILLVYVGLFFISNRIARIACIIIVSILGLITMGLIQYFNKAMVPLGADIYGYSLADIRQTTGAGGGIDATIIIAAIIFLVVVLFSFYYSNTRLKLKNYYAYTIVTVILFFTILPRVNLGSFTFTSNFSENLAINKTDFFLSESFRHFFPRNTDVDIYADNYIGDFGDGFKQKRGFTYVDEERYPFLHYDSTNDVLSPFFSRTAAPPNVVIIVVEGLGRAFSNDAAYLGSFTPFIDSLSANSLYWENLLSGGGRTFAALPTILGSLPFLKNGFSDLGDKMPPHLSLISLFKLNGYRTSFYYGGNASFDKMSSFLRISNIDNIHEEDKFPVGYTKMPSSNGFTWGYPDKELFRYYMSEQNIQKDKPHLSILLTISTHSPFRINEQEAYLKKFEERMNLLSLDDEKKASYRNYKNQYASILYADDALKDFFITYATRSDFDNTIFVITGDHRMPEIPMVSKIDRYHVPLLIYSPLLNRTAKFSVINSQFDLAPSILSFFKANYNFKVPSLISWIGTGLDTIRSLNSQNAYPLIQTKNDFVDYVIGDDFLNNETLFKLGTNLSTTMVNDERNLAGLKSAFEQFKSKNDKINNGAKLLPDTIYQRYFPR